MNTLSLDALTDGSLGPLTLRFAPGLTVVLGDSEATLEALVELGSGERKPQRGNVLLDGRPVFGDPSGRRRLACVLPREALLPAKSVRAALLAQDALRERVGDPLAALGSLGLERLAEVPPGALSALEKRAVAFAYAASQREAEVFVLHDPLALAGIARREVLAGHCRAMAERGSVVLTSPLLEDALLLGGRSLLLEGGRVATNIPNTVPLAEFALESRDAERLGARLARERSLTVDFEPKLSPRQLRVSGSDLTEVARLITLALEQEHCVLDSMQPVPPSVAQWLAARRSGTTSPARAPAPRAVSPGAER